MTLHFIKQNKGTALEKVTAKNRDPGPNYYLSTKFDGQMVQIAYDGLNSVRMWSSNGHPFYHMPLAMSIIHTQQYAFHVEAEFVGKSIGMHGDRGKSSKITTYRTGFTKGIFDLGSSEESFKVFDILSFDGQDVRNDPFSARYGMLMQLHTDSMFDVIPHDAGVTIEEAVNRLDGIIADGWEGIILTHKDHVVKSSGRSQLRIKLKGTPTGYATIIGTKEGTEAREGTIGSLLLRDEDGREFSSGTGLNSAEWVLQPWTLLDVRVKFGYESIDKKSGTYIQPRYLGAISPFDPEGKELVRLNEL